VAKEHRLKCGDAEYGYYFQITLKDADMGTYSMTGGESVALKIRRRGSTDATTFGSGSVHNATSAILRFTTASADLAKITPGIYDAQVVVDNERSELFEIEVRDDL